MNPESKLTTKIIKHLRAKGAFVFKNHGSRYSMIGLPDLVACVDGKFFSFEVKVGSNTTTEMQEAVGQDILLAHGRWCVVRSIEDVELALSKETADETALLEQLL